MDPTEVYVRTDKGQGELRKAGLDPGARVVFFMTDGVASVSDILAQVSGLGVTEATFDQLRSLGFITPKPRPEKAAALPDQGRPAAPPPEPDRVFMARQFLNETAVNAAGLRSYFFTLKLERAYTLAELRLLLPDYTKLIEKGTGKLEADLLIRRAQELTAERPR